MPKQEEEVYYFAYGSNMNPERMKERKAEYTKRELGRLLGQRLVFNKASKDWKISYANVIPDKDSTVYGAVYSCTPDALAILDGFEGVHSNQYYRKIFDAVLDNGEKRQVVAYIACLESCHTTETPIARWYLNHLLAGRDILPKEYVEFLESFQQRTV